LPAVPEGCRGAGQLSSAGQKAVPSQGSSALMHRPRKAGKRTGVGARVQPPGSGAGNSPTLSTP
jgi:hypothetical protein